MESGQPVAPSYSGEARAQCPHYGTHCVVHTWCALLKPSAHAGPPQSVPCEILRVSSASVSSVQSYDTDTLPLRFSNGQP